MEYYEKIKTIVHAVPLWDEDEEPSAVSELTAGTMRLLCSGYNDCNRAVALYIESIGLGKQWALGERPTPEEAAGGIVMPCEIISATCYILQTLGSSLLPQGRGSGRGFTHPPVFKQRCVSGWSGNEIRLISRLVQIAIDAHDAENPGHLREIEDGREIAVAWAALLQHTQLSP